MNPVARCGDDDDAGLLPQRRASRKSSRQEEFIEFCKAPPRLGRSVSDFLAKAMLIQNTT
jgi:hypothetical protein